MADKQATTQRDGFKSKWGFILACIGSAVGMGNIWRFPIMVSLWGGMTFLIPYFICVILIGSTGVIGEFALGRATGAGPIGAFGKCTELRGNRKIGEAIGFIPVLGSMALAIGYTVVMGWIFKYTAIAITGDMHAMGQDMAATSTSLRSATCRGSSLRSLPRSPSWRWVSPAALRRPTRS